MKHGSKSIKGTNGEQLDSCSPFFNRAQNMDPYPDMTSSIHPLALP